MNNLLADVLIVFSGKLVVLKFVVTPPLPLVPIRIQPRFALASIIPCFTLIFQSSCSYLLCPYQLHWKVRTCKSVVHSKSLKISWSGFVFIQKLSMGHSDQLFFVVSSWETLLLKIMLRSQHSRSAYALL